jgi:hypothetical protein
MILVVQPMFRHQSPSRLLRDTFGCRKFLSFRQNIASAIKVRKAIDENETEADDD